MRITQNKRWYTIKPLIPKFIFEYLLDFNNWIQNRRFKGNKYYCPVCNHWFRELNSNACPNCGAGIRHRFLWMFLQRKTDFFTNNYKVLHFAPEHCFYRKFKDQRNLNYLTADLHSPRAMVKADMMNLQFSDNAFDIILTSNILAHVEDDVKAFKELFRVIKPGGWIMFMEPINHSYKTTFVDTSIRTRDERQKIYGHYDYKRVYGNDFKNILESYGFKVSTFVPEDICSEKEIEEMKLTKGYDMFICSK